MTDEHCPYCGAAWSDGQTCTDHFHLMGAWELEHQMYDVHHLMVLGYHLQHPHLYSPETLEGGKQMLVQFLEGGVTPQQMRHELRDKVDSGKRKHKITGTADHYGKYAHPVNWTMHAGDVTAGGIENFYVNVRAWATSILAELRASGNMP